MIVVFVMFPTFVCFFLSSAAVAGEQVVMERQEKQMWKRLMSTISASVSFRRLKNFCLALRLFEHIELARSSHQSLPDAHQSLSDSCGTGNLDLYLTSRR